MYDLIVSGGLVVTPDEIFESEVAVADGTIQAIGRDLGDAHEIVDARGKYVFPGAIDSHAHLNDPGFTWREDFAHGTLAAAAGGVTTILDMPLQNEPALSTRAIFEKKQGAVASKALVDYAFWGGLLDDNLSELASLQEAGVVGFKVFIGPVSPDYRSLDMGTIREAMEIVRGFGGLIGFHAEDYSIIKHEEARAQRRGGAEWDDFLRSRPLIAETLATRNVIDLVRETGCRAHICHVSHPDVAELVRAAQIEGLPVSGETCTHYLVFTEDDVRREGAIFKCAPPLRSAAARDGLWRYVADGTLGCVGSDHSPCAPEEKDVRTDDGRVDVFRAWGGISGIQSVMPVFYDQAVNRRNHAPTLLAQSLSEGPARIFGLYGRKGAVKVGFDADLVVFDPEREWEITPDSLHYLNKISAFAGLKGRGMPIKTIVRGEVVYREGKQAADAGTGRLVKR